MKKIYTFFITLLLLTACHNNKVEQVSDNNDTIVTKTVGIKEESTAKEPSLNDINIEFNYDIDSIYDSKAPRMTQKEFDELQLKSIKDFPYSYDVLTKAKLIYRDENGKIITIEAYTGGERNRYLLSYNKDNKLLDCLQVSYEDYVEYFSRTSSKIQNGEIIVTEIKYIDDSFEGSSDTIIDKYKISPELRFIHQNK